MFKLAHSSMANVVSKICLIDNDWHRQNAVLKKWANEAIAHRLETFVQTKSEEQRVTVERSFAQRIEAIRVNAAWVKRDANVP